MNSIRFVFTKEEQGVSEKRYTWNESTTFTITLDGVVVYKQEWLFPLFSRTATLSGNTL